MQASTTASPTPPHNEAQRRAEKAFPVSWDQFHRDARALAGQYSAFQAAYLAHIEREDRELLPVMHALSRRQLAEIANQMQARRPRGNRRLRRGLRRRNS